LTNQAFLRLGLFSFNQGDLNQALRYYKKIFDNNPSAQESQDAVTGIEEIYVDNLGQPEEYVKFIKTVPGMDISEFKRDSINFRSAEIQYENAEYDKAVIALGDYIKGFPRGAYIISAHYYKAESHGVQKQYDAALSEYDYVIQKGQNEFYAKALRKAAIISYNHALKFDKAYNYYVRLEGVASSEEQGFEALMGAMRSAYRAKLNSELPSLSAKVIAHPRASQADKATAYFFQAKSYFEQENYVEASRAFERVILSSDNVQTAEARYLRALMAYKRNDLSNAERLAENANKASSSYPYWVAKNLILISDVLVAKKDLFNAKAPLEAIIANFADDPNILSEATSKLVIIQQMEEDASRIETNPDENNLNLLDTIPFEKSEKRRN
jgi:tetratricopeptide (TPR) repeat protein